jgi:hypothetical protein
MLPAGPRLDIRKAGRQVADQDGQVARATDFENSR